MATDTDRPRNTKAQLAAIKAQDDAWELERTQPLWEVTLAGPPALWVARPGKNVAKEDGDLELRIGDEVVYSGKAVAGEPQPWVAAATASVQLRAATEDQARARALAHNPGYDTVTAARELEG